MPLTTITFQEPVSSKHILAVLSRKIDRALRLMAVKREAFGGQVLSTCMCQSAQLVLDPAVLMRPVF